MKILDTIYRSTYKFWVITRLVLIILFSSSVMYFLAGDLDLVSIVTGIFILGFVVSMLVIAVKKFTKKKTRPFLHIYNGVFAILFSFAVLYLSLAYYNMAQVWYVLYLPLWLILYGVWELVFESRDYNF